MTPSEFFAMVNDGCLTVLPDACDVLVDAGDYEGLVILLDAVRNAVASLRVVDSTIEGQLVQLVPRKLVEIPGFGSVEVKKGSDRREWDHDAIASLVAARAADECFWDPLSGERYPPAEVAQRVVNLVMRAAGVSYWRKIECTGLGINIDDYCEKTPGRKSAIVRRAS